MFYHRDAVSHFYSKVQKDSGGENHSDPLMRKRCLFLLLTEFFHVCPHENFLYCGKLQEKGICKMDWLTDLS